MPRLFHVSEEPGIARFEPRPPPSLDSGVTGDAVWAVDEDHLPNYLLPRDCPRVTYTSAPETTPDDAARYFEGAKAKRIIAVEEAWKQRILDTALYIYDMPDADFSLVDRSAGYYIARSAVTPLDVREIRDPISEIASRDCVLRFVSELWPLRDAVVASSLDYSIIRMRNAKR